MLFFRCTCQFDLAWTCFSVCLDIFYLCTCWLSICRCSAESPDLSLRWWDAIPTTWPCNLMDTRDESSLSGISHINQRMLVSRCLCWRKINYAVSTDWKPLLLLLTVRLKNCAAFIKWNLLKHYIKKEKTNLSVARQLMNTLEVFNNFLNGDIHRMLSELDMSWRIIFRQK